MALTQKQQLWSKEWEFHWKQTYSLRKDSVHRLLDTRKLHSMGPGQGWKHHNYSKTQLPTSRTDPKQFCFGCFSQQRYAAEATSMRVSWETTNRRQHDEWEKDVLTCKVFTLPGMHSWDDVSPAALPDTDSKMKTLSWDKALFPMFPLGLEGRKSQCHKVQLSNTFPYMVILKKREWDASHSTAS